eukprot:TRINITY_DN430_c0_g2_i1.p1 TRINITY_DN430_c0_g2~~TRINITY_DN430_c0_g2_i1.p1  ORF type:complete len:218 (-),score=9.09 TRINITY_DN430_c0_g2_i1:79-732(-)
MEAESLKYYCTICGGVTKQEPETVAMVQASETSSDATSAIESAFFEIYDRIDQTGIALGELNIEYGPVQWQARETVSTGKYSFGWCPAKSTLFVDLTDVPLNELNKLILEDLILIAESKEAESLVVAIRRPTAELSLIIRSLITFGFDRILGTEAQKLVSNPDVHVLQLEVSQECDFVDLEQISKDQLKKELVRNWMRPHSLAFTILEWVGLAHLYF